MKTEKLFLHRNHFRDIMLKEFGGVYITLAEVTAILRAPADQRRRFSTDTRLPYTGGR